MLYDVPVGWWNSVALAVDGAGNVFVPVRAQSEDGPFEVRVAKYAATSGALLWEKRPGSYGESLSLNAVAVDSAGNVVLSFWDGFRIAKFAGTDGTLLWQERLSAPPGASSGETALELGRNGMIA